MTASPPKANGSTRPRTPLQFADWRITADPEEQRTPQPEPAADRADLVAAAEAAAIRARGEAEAEAIRIAAEAAAQAEIVKAEEEARKQKIVNDRAARKAAEEQAASNARIADHNRRRDEADRARADAHEAAQAEKATERKAAEEIAEADDKWRAYAIRFAIVCGIVSLPVQMSFFWNPHAPWMAAAPIMLEGAAWVVHRGARAAAVSKRPVWHYRAIVWLLALIAAAINLYHGLHSFDPGTALATAFASIAGPGVWDLHEHGRIRRRDGVLTRKERKAKKRADARAEALKKLEEKAQRFEKEAADKAAEEARQKLAADREATYPKVWDEAKKIAAAVGETTVTDAVWARAYRNIQGTDPGESIESITARRAAEKRVQAALTGTPVNTLSKTTNAQRAIQTPRSSYKPVPPRRTPGDTPRYSRAAGRAHGDLLRRKNTRTKDQ
jgi:chemotaxis protein histidine kinase CheA